MNDKLKDLVDQFPAARAQFEMSVEAVCLEVTEIAKQISPAIGDISIDEAKQVIIREFTQRMYQPFFYVEFKAKKK